MFMETEILIVTKVSDKMIDSQTSKLLIESNVLESKHVGFLTGSVTRWSQFVVSKEKQKGFK